MFKFKRSIAGLAVVAAAAVGGLGAGGATPAVAEVIDPGCHTWQIPSGLVIDHGNRWTVSTGRRISAFKWVVYGYHPGVRRTTGTLRLTRFDTSGDRPRVVFTISWTSGAQGVYAGEISATGYIDGYTHDRKDWRSGTTFHVRDAMDCA
jgi:hypothetical protein